VALLSTIAFLVTVARYVKHRWNGGAPESLVVGMFVLWLVTACIPLLFAALIWHVRLLRKFRMSGVLRRVSTAVLLFLIVIGFDVNCGPASLRAAFRREPGVTSKPAENFTATSVTPHLGQPIEGGKNILWCGTFQLAWNEACQLFGGDIKLADANPLVTALNRHEFTRESLDEGSYVARVGFVRSNIYEMVERELAKFGGTLKPPLLPPKRMTPGPDDFIAYAALYKRLQFETPFERLDSPLVFGGAKVSAFGITGARASSNLYSQILIHDYIDTTNFVIELQTKSSADRLLLAIVPSGQMLVQTVADVRRRVRDDKVERATEGDVLQVPRLAVDVTRTYREIERQIVVSPRPFSTEMYLLSAVQRTRFEMNEKGVELESEAHTSFGCAKNAEPERRHVMIFDRPFLIILERNGAKMPYFALWVANAELLMP
jgi:hypothetical protein